MSRHNEDLFLTEANIKEMWAEVRSPSELAILNGLTVIEMCLLIACKHLQVTNSPVFFKIH